jgi:hypothetical protein
MLRTIGGTIIGGETDIDSHFSTLKTVNRVYGVSNIIGGLNEVKR